MTFDNAVENAEILNHMTPKWHKIFLTFGILIAVVGMRFIIPLVIVAISENVNILKAVSIAFTNHTMFQQLIQASHIAIMCFGGSFLMMVSFDFLFSNFDDDNQPRNVWIKPFENLFFLHSMKVHIISTLCVLLLTYWSQCIYMPRTVQY
jgi:hypothetical protein